MTWKRTAASLRLSFGLASAACAALLFVSVGRPATPGTVSVQLHPRVIEYGAARVAVSGITATAVKVRLLGATDPKGRAYRWTPYRWRRLALVSGTWRGDLPAPPLQGVYQLELRASGPRQLLASPHWLLRVLPPGALRHRPFATPRAVIRDFVRHLPGNEVLVARRHWSQAPFDHRDPRLNQIFAIAYAPRHNTKPGSRLGLFITTFRDGFDGRWRLLQATLAPYD
jgi:hypothetical protein